MNLSQELLRVSNKDLNEAKEPLTKLNLNGLITGLEYNLSTLKKVWAGLSEDPDSHTLSQVKYVLEGISKDIDSFSKNILLK